MQNPFTPTFDKLPKTLPLFPLANAVVMPGTQLPLNVFEPRYLNMVFDALAAERMIGMVQPDPMTEDPHRETVYKTGTAGRISAFNETSDGRLLVVLSGVCRFDIREEFATTRGYRRVLVDWSRFHEDYDPNPTVRVERTRLLNLLKAHLNAQRIDTDWKSLRKLAFPVLVNLLIDQLPLAVPERQALIEAVTAQERAQLMIRLLNFSVTQPIPAPHRPQ